jgi:hypothetical protein
MPIEHLTDQELDILEAQGLQGLSDDALDRLEGVQSQQMQMYQTPETLSFAGLDTGIPTSPEVQAGLTAAGKTLNEWTEGAKQLYYKAAGNEQALENQRLEQAKIAQAYGQMQEDYPVSTTVGEIAPYLPAAAIPGGLAVQAGVGAGMEGLRYGEDQATQAAIGGALSGVGYGAGRMASRVYQSIRSTGSSVKSQLAPEAERLAQRAEELGMKLLPGQKTGSLPLQQLEATAKSTPFTSGLFEPYMQANQATINRLAAESIGESGEEITGDMLANAADRIGKIYDDFGRNIAEVPVDEGQLLAFMDGASVDAERYLNNYFKRFPALDDGLITGEQAGRLRQIVQKDIRNAWRNNPGVAEDLQDFQVIITDSIENSSPGAKEALRGAGSQWRNLKALESGKVVTKGNVNARSLDTQLRKLDKGGYLRGRSKSDYYDAIRAASQFGDVVGDSGTATRSWMGMLAQDPQAALVGGLTLRPATEAYMRTGGHPAISGLLGSIPGPGAGQYGAAIPRPMATEFEEL